MHPRSMDFLTPFINAGNGGATWSVLARIMTELAAKAADNRTISIGATYRKAHCTASSLWLKKGVVAGRSGGPKVV